MSVPALGFTLASAEAEDFLDTVPEDSQVLYRSAESGTKDQGIMCDILEVIGNTYFHRDSAGNELFLEGDQLKRKLEGCLEPLDQSDKKEKNEKVQHKFVKAVLEHHKREVFHKMMTR